MKSVKGTLTVGFLVLLGVMIIQAVVAWVYLSQSKRDLATSAQSNSAASTQLAELASLGQALRRFEKEYFIYVGDAQKRDGYSKEWQQGYDKIMKSVDDITTNRARIWTAADIAEAGKWRASALAYGEGFDALRAKVASNEISTTLAANDAIRDAKDKFRVYLQGTADLLKRKNAESQELATSINRQFDIVLFMGALLSAAGCLLLALMAFFVPRSIEAPIQVLADAANSMSSGDLEQPFRLKSSVKEFRALAEHLERMRIAQKGLLESLTRRSRSVKA
jgi:HAMP domain-containing protein